MGTFLKKLMIENCNSNARKCDNDSEMK